ncbi:hypothetical protein [Metabacillus fastidiosus]|uniref:hypothetical protein n=1 Tax=Metabacillus fastidiosus TaxID=1458 RepID=UPI003D299ACF
MENQRLREKTWFIVLMLFIFFPVGLYLMWKYANWNKIAKVIVTVVIILSIILGYTGENEKISQQVSTQPKEEKTKDTSAYTASNVYKWLKESGLVQSEPKDDTKSYKGNTKGIVQVLEGKEVHVLEFETEEQAKEAVTISNIALSYKNIYVLLIKGQSQKDNFLKVLEAEKPLTDLETYYASEEQKQVAELMKNSSDFLPLVEAYYNLPKDQKSQTWDDFIIDKEVTWSGTIADLEAIGDSIVIYGSTEGYNGEDWLTISTKKKNLLPYVFITELKSEAMKKGMKNGDKVTIKAVVGSRGDKEMQYNWKLYKGEVIK